MKISAAYYLWRSIYYLMWAHESQQLYEHSYIFLSWWVIVTVIIGPICLMLSGLAIFHFGLALNNITTLDGMGGSSQRMPCVPDSVYEKNGIYNVKSLILQQKKLN